MLYILHALVRRLFPEKGGTSSTPSVATATTAFPGVRSSSPRFIVTALLIAAAAIFLQTRARSEVFPPRCSFTQFPMQLGGWSGTDQIIDEETLKILKPSDYLLRVYRNPQETQDITLFIPYYLSQRAGEAPHSPQHCLPGSGWTPLENRRITLTTPGHEPFPANRYLVTDGELGSS